MVTDTATAMDGLLYSDDLLNTFPVLDDGDHHPMSKGAPRPAGSGFQSKGVEEPIRALSAAHFAQFHMQHTLAHPRDGVLFPFLHGLEGDNLAQNTFFASSLSSSPQPQGSAHRSHASGRRQGGHGQKITPRLPKYRGLIWVVCEDDLQKAGDGVTLRVLRRKPVHGPGEPDDLLMSPPSSSSEELEDDDDEDSDESCFEENFEEDGLSMMVLDIGQSEDHPYDLHYEGSHMHPVSLRSPGPLNTNIDICPSHHSASSSSEASMSTSATSTSSSVDSTPNSSIFSPEAMGSPECPTTTAGADLAAAINSASLQHKQDDEDNGISTPCASPSPLPPATATTSSTHIPFTTENHPNPLQSHFDANIDISNIGDRSPPPSTRYEKSKHHHHPRRRVCLDPRNPPLLTSTFRPKELLRKVRSTPTTTQSESDSERERERVKRGLVIHPFRPPPPPPSPAPSTPTGFRPTIDDDHEFILNGHGEADDPSSSWTWEFVPAKVPDGISLRNFGIQVPIYATLSDIVIYSPHGATPSTLALARRFREAIKAKKMERIGSAGVDVDLLCEVDDEQEGNVKMEEGNEHDEAYGGIGDPVPCASPTSMSPCSACPSSSPTSSQGSVDSELTRPHPFPFFHHQNSDSNNPVNLLPQQTQNHTEISIPAASKADLKAKAKEVADGFIQYRVFVLDADEEEMRKTMPHLMMKICKEGEGWQCQTGDGNIRGKDRSGHADSGHGPHTDRTDGHIVELGNVEEEEERKRQSEKEGIRMDVDAVNGERNKDRSCEGGMDVDLSMPEDEEKNSNRVLNPTPNTIDFALREKEEMRDLTKASPIINLRPSDFSSLSLPLGSAAAAASPSSTTHLGSHTQQSLSQHQHHQHLVPASQFGLKNSAQGPATTTNPRFDPRIGQIALGNSGDVPIVPEIPGQFRHAVGGVDVARKGDLKALMGHLRDVESLKDYLVNGYEEEEVVEGEGVMNSDLGVRQEDLDIDIDLPHDDPFNYLATNDPRKGFGFDICIECHDLAPFPTHAHMRAAEEHLGMLDMMWKERWEATWNAREEKRLSRKMKEALGSSSPSEGVSSSSYLTMKRNLKMAPPPPAPPRPPPHANAVIHLPFPSSPSNSQSSMVALMPFIRFLEKWIRPVPVPVIHPPSLPPLNSTRQSSPLELRNLMTMTSVDPKTVPLGHGNADRSNNSSSSSSAPPQSSNCSGGSGSRRWSSVSSLLPSFPSFPGIGSGGSKDQNQPQQQTQPTRPTNNNNNGTRIASPVNGHSHISQLGPPATTGPPNIPLPPSPSARTRSLTSPSGQYPSQLFQPPTCLQARTRPLKVLLYSADGYTETSVPALCLLMSIQGLGLPEAYLELQVETKRSFFVYQSDLGLLRRVEGRLREEREREKERERERERERFAAAAHNAAFSNAQSGSINANGKRIASTPGPSHPIPAPAARGGGGGNGYWPGSNNNTNNYNSSSEAGATRPPPGNSGLYMGRPAAKSISFAARPQPPSSDPQQGSDILRSSGELPATNPAGPGFSPAGRQLHSNDREPYSIQKQLESPKGRPRATTSPWLPSLFDGDHQSWFNDPRFDGSFPSRVLPFLYLGNLNHASNVYMLHALGITHVVSVGECALVPPPHHMTTTTPHTTGGSGCYSPGAGPPQFKGSNSHGSLWLEEREGRIKVMDIKGVCDDGIDTLEPQLEPICDWIDKARQEGGQVLVHCRVGVSRSATVTIAYVMKHLNLPLVDAYLIVRSRRLSVLIQPNMRLLYNLCGWEIRLAKERAKGDQEKLKLELARTLTWPYLAKEVHALNEKYLH